MNICKDRIGAVAFNFIAKFNIASSISTILNLNLNFSDEIQKRMSMQSEEEFCRCQKKGRFPIRRAHEA